MIWRACLEKLRMRVANVAASSALFHWWNAAQIGQREERLQ